MGTISFWPSRRPPTQRRAGWNSQSWPTTAPTPPFKPGQFFAGDGSAWLSANAVVLTANLYIGTALSQTAVLSIPKLDLLSATTTNDPDVKNNYTLESNLPFTDGSGMQAVVNSDASASTMVLGTENALQLGLITISNPQTAFAIIGSPVTITLPVSLVSAVGPAVSAPQPNNAAPIAATVPGSYEGIGTNLSNVVEVNGDLWAAETVLDTATQTDAVAWVEISVSTKTVIQSGLISDPNLFFYFPSIAVNTAGDVVIGFSGSDSSQYISSYASIGTTSAGVTTFKAPSLLQAGQGIFLGNGLTPDNVGAPPTPAPPLWGDYSATVVDPSNSNNFWTFQQISDEPNSRTTNNWAVQATEITVPPVVTVTAPSSAAVTVNGNITFSGGNGNAISLADAVGTANNTSDSLKLTVSNGTLSLGSTNGLTITSGSNNSASMTVSGTLASLNADLSGLVYTPNSNYTGTATITLSDTDTTDGAIGTALVTIMVSANPPAASAGPNQTVNQGATVNLNGSVTYTSIPGQTLSSVWQVANGPGTVTFANSALPQTTATFSAAGTYYLSLVATYDGMTDQSYVTITVDAAVPPSTVSLQQGTNNYSGMVDTYLNGAKSDDANNYVTSTTLSAAGPDKNEEDALLLWNLTSYAGTIQSASITVYVTTGSTATYNLYALARSWSPSQVTFDQASSGVYWQTAGANGSADYNSTVLGTLTSTGTGFATITLNTAGIARLQAWIANPSTNYGFIVRDPVASDKAIITFASSKYATIIDRPTLTINFSRRWWRLPAMLVTNPVTSATAAVNGTSGVPNTGYMEAVEVDLATLYFQYVEWQQSGSSSPFTPNPTQANVNAADISGTSVDVVITVEPTLVSQVDTALTALGMTSITVSGNTISGFIPISQLATLAMTHGVVSATAAPLINDAAFASMANDPNYDT